VTPIGTELDHVSIRVGDLAAASRFFTDVLGFSLEKQFEDESRGIRVAFYRNGSALLELVEPLNADARIEGQMGGLDHIALRVEDADAAYAALEAAGIPLAGAPRSSNRDPQARVFFSAPEGLGGLTIQFIEAG
jgi:catechol 2,3-dioxygenase-like lactoylglutathione lyase family enzyme